ncbi:MAG: hypothetical protein ABI321_02365 [Polyangia bacterium]
MKLRGLKLRGWVQLVRDGVDAGSRRIEQLQKESLAQPLALLGEVPGLADVSMVIASVATLSLVGTHTAIRAVNQVVATVLDAVLSE